MDMIYGFEAPKKNQPAEQKKTEDQKDLKHSNESFENKEPHDEDPPSSAFTSHDNHTNILSSTSEEKKDERASTETVKATQDLYRLIEERKDAPGSLLSLNCGLSQINDDDMALLNRTPLFQNLESLSLWNCPITDKGMESLLQAARMKALTSFDLRTTKIGDKSLELISRIPTMVAVDLRGCTNITDDGIAKLALLENLKLLDVRETPTTERGLGPINEAERQRQAKLEKDGFLEKRGGVRKNWKVRWFHLTKDLLTYRAQPTDKLILGSIDLRGIKIRAAEEMKERPYSFKITTDKRIYYIHGKDQEEMTDWIKATIRSIQYKPLVILFHSGL